MRNDPRPSDAVQSLLSVVFSLASAAVYVVGHPPSEPRSFLAIGSLSFASCSLLIGPPVWLSKMSHDVPVIAASSASPASWDELHPNQTDAAPRAERTSVGFTMLMMTRFGALDMPVWDSQISAR